MADGLQLNAGSGGGVAATDDVGSQHYQRVKRSLGRDGIASDTTTPARLLSAASTNATSLKASAGTVWWFHVTNTNAAVRYLKFYNKASSPTVGTDTPQHTFCIPAATTGAGFCLSPEGGMDFSTGIAYALTTGVADNDTGAVAANEIILNLGYT